MTLHALNCPNCGAGIASDTALCKFCKTRLKTVACPACFGLMFAGAKFCDHCGALAAHLEQPVSENAGDCPRCRRALEVLRVDSTNVRSCTQCDGLWMDTVTFETVCTDRERQSAVLTYFREWETRPDRETRVNYLPCPDCGELMNRSNFNRASGVIIDVCKRHGVWFDANELQAIVGFIQKGGMEIARQRQITDLKDERTRLRSERLFSGQRDDMQAENTSGVLFLVRSLFE